MKQAEFAKAAGITPSYLSLIEANKRMPRLNTIARIAQQLRIPSSLIHLLAIDEDSEKENLPIEDLGRAFLQLLQPAVPPTKQASLFK